MTVHDVIQTIEGFAPAGYQESYDNSGLQVGNAGCEVTGILLCVDVTELVVEEAMKMGANLIISHHPLIFNGLKQLVGNSFIEKTVVMAIKADIVIYSCHTNIDQIFSGVSFKMAEKLGMSNLQVLRPLAGNLCKLVTFVPDKHAEKVRKAIFDAGAGHIGNYDCCSYNIAGEGTFRALDLAHPFVGEKNILHREPEIRVETIFPKFLETAIVSALLKSHPYEEVAFDIYPLANLQKNAGAGVIGELESRVRTVDFLQSLKNIFHMPVIRHTNIIRENVKKVALCGGSGSFLLPDAKRAQADVLVTSDFKYHQFFDAERAILIADIGHYESEQFTLEIFYDLLVKKFPNFAVRFTNVKTNPINYF
jgi:dinuclear metal center YbgI/SA1388 family protein